MLNRQVILEPGKRNGVLLVLSLRTAAAGRVYNRLAMLAVTFVAVLMLSACSGGSLNNFFSGSGTGTDSGGMAPISFANIIGPPKDVGDQLTTQLASAAQQKNIPVVTEKGKPTAYTVQGYLAQSNERNAEKFSYIMDVTDKSGQRVHRILGEETVPAKPGAKPWSSINQAAMQKIAAKTANELATWLPTQSPPAAVASSARPSSDESSSKSSSRHPVSTASATSRTGAVTAVVPPVSGAPGDGRTSLTNAMRSRLEAQGVRLANIGGNGVYKVSGRVTMDKASGGNESVKIVWQLTSPSGQNLGTVTQQSTVPKGSLDKSWGQAAVSAGNAAAAEVVKLIKKNRG